MAEYTVKHETLTRLAIAVGVAIVWGFCAYVTFTTSQADDTVLGLADLGLSKAAIVAALYRRLRSATARRKRRHPGRGS